MIIRCISYLDNPRAKIIMCHSGEPKALPSLSGHMGLSPGHDSLLQVLPFYPRHTPCQPCFTAFLNIFAWLECDKASRWQEWRRVWKCLQKLSYCTKGKIHSCCSSSMCLLEGKCLGLNVPCPRTTFLRYLAMETLYIRERKMF